MRFLSPLPAVPVLLLLLSEEIDVLAASELLFREVDGVEAVLAVFTVFASIFRVCCDVEAEAEACDMIGATVEVEATGGGGDTVEFC